MNAPRPAGPQPHVLILHESPDLLAVLGELLEDEGYRVTTATTLPGLDEVRRLAPQVIVQDLVFDGSPARGWMFSRRVRSDDRLAKVRIVICTVARIHRDAEMIASLRRSGIRLVYLPCAANEILAAVAKLAPPLRLISTIPAPASPAEGKHDGPAPLSLGTAIKARRLALGLSQEALAERVVKQGDGAFRQSDVSRLERGKVALPHRDRLRHIAAALGISPGELLASSGWAGMEPAPEGKEPRAVLPAPVIVPRPESRPGPIVPARSEPELPPTVLPLLDALGRMRAAISDAEGIRQDTRRIMATSEALRTLYNRPYGVKSLPRRD
ncbi:MAG: helix-turn-helix domain-containing protein [Thermomicrobiales bacterium]